MNPNHCCHGVPREIIDAARVLAFAKENGFPDADILYWDQEIPEFGLTSLEELAEEEGEDYKVGIGVALNGRKITVRKVRNEDTDETSVEIEV